MKQNLMALGHEYRTGFIGTADHKTVLLTS